MANQHPAQHAQHAPAKPKVDLSKAQAVVSLTPEQYEHSVAAADAPPRPQIEMGGSGTAKASFQDATGADCPILSSEWSSTGSVTVKADDKDPTSATLTPIAVGPGTVTVIAQTDDGPAQASTDFMVVDKIGAPVGGTIAITVQAPAAAKKAA